MPLKDPEKRKEYYRQYKIKNKEKARAQRLQWDIDNKDRNRELQRTWLNTPAGRKSSRIQNWKQNGVIHDDFNELYEKYINTEFCELCNVKLTVDKAITKTTRCLDHDHTTGLFRNVVCNSCNVRLPRQ